MRIIKKKILKIASNGASSVSYKNSFLKNKYLYYDRDYNNMSIYLKVKNDNVNLDINENVYYRKKYLT